MEPTDAARGDSPLATAADRIGDVAVLDTVGSVYRRIGDLMPRPLRELLQGRQLGHALHPLLVTVPIGAWTSAALLDLTGRTSAARTLVGVGALVVAPSAWTGLADWQRLGDQGSRRIGVAHGGVNALGAALAAGSWLARRSGRHGLGRVLLFGALGAVGVSGYLGGHLTYRRGAGVERPPVGTQPVSTAPVDTAVSTAPVDSAE